MKYSFALAIAFLVWAQVLLVSQADAQVVNSDASITGISRAFNPAISVNGLFLYLDTNLEERPAVAEELEPGIHLQELELVFTSNVDVYLKADATIAFSEEEASVENLYLTTLQLPFYLQAKIGKINVPFGLQNPLHTHTWPFVEPPMINEAIFGFEGWKDTGIALSWLAPFPWYFNLTGAGFEAGEETPFNSGHQGDLDGLVYLDNLFPMGESATLRVGGSYAWGPASLEGDSILKPGNYDSQVWGADLQIKWRPAELMRSRALVLQSEYLEHKYFSSDKSISDPISGYYVLGMAQVSRFFWLQARYDSLRRPDYQLNRQDESRYRDRWSAAVAFVPTEFQAYKVEYSEVNLGDQIERLMLAQINFTIGSHPAHAY